MDFINRLKRLLVAERGLLELSEAADFDLLGFNDSTLSISLFALVRADGLTVKRIAEVCDEFLERTRSLPGELRLNARGRNPNGLLGFVFEGGCPPHLLKFIRKQTRVSHSALRGGVVVPWVFDVKSRRIYTHRNPVSLMPPVVVPAGQVWPGLEYLEGFLQAQGHASEPADEQARDSLRVEVGGESKIRILFLTADPGDASKQRLDKECRAIDEALTQSKFRDRFEIAQHWAVEVSQLQKYFLRHRPHFVHFSGHGDAAEGILLEDGNGKSRSVPTEALGQLFSILKDDIRCVVLNACYSEGQARAIARHIDAVIGIGGFIERPAAISFAAAFYQALGYDRSIKEAFELGRLQIRLENLGDEEPLKLLMLRTKPRT
ncbi:MAG TPA: CHAT domain-containing protein [Pyrinomonadaceae bacterium]